MSAVLLYNMTELEIYYYYYSEVNIAILCAQMDYCDLLLLGHMGKTCQSEHVSFNLCQL